MDSMLLPIALLLMLASGVIKRVPLYDTFIEGAKNGLKTAMRIAPYLMAMLAAVALLTASGAMEWLLALLSPPMKALGVPEGALPVLLMGPFSGSASLAMLQKTLQAYGPDSLTGKTASVMMGVGETFFYTFSLYLAAGKVRTSRHAAPAALLAWLAGGLVSAWVCSWLW